MQKHISYINDDIHNNGDLRGDPRSRGDGFQVADSLPAMVDSIMECKPSRLTIKDGVDILFRREELGWGISLSIHQGVQWPQLFEHALKRRFVEADVYEGYFLCLDCRKSFVVWCELRDGDFDREYVNRVISRALQLIGLTSLSLVDSMCTRR